MSRTDGRYFFARMLCAAALCALGLVAPVSASADVPPPLYEGGMSFPQINGPADPEEYSWTVELDHNQALQQIDEQHAAVFYNDLTPAFSITATPGHDATGATVPMSLLVSNGDVVTLIVHHRAGNPAAGGAPFRYPIIQGYGWEGGLTTTVVDFYNRPPEREGGAPPACLVPSLDGKTLKRSKRELKDAGCAIGKVVTLRSARARSGRVVKQSPRPGNELAAGAAVTVTLGPRSMH
jgi:PASTA domain